MQKPEGVLMAWNKSMQRLKLKRFKVSCCLLNYHPYLWSASDPWQALYCNCSSHSQVSSLAAPTLSSTCAPSFAYLMTGTTCLMASKEILSDSCFHSFISGIYAAWPLGTKVYLTCCLWTVSAQYERRRIMFNHKPFSETLSLMLALKWTAHELLCNK